MDPVRSGSERGAGEGAVAAYIAERADKRARGLDVPEHLPFSACAEPLFFAGTRMVSNQPLVLLRRSDGRVLVRALAPREAERLRRASIGERVRVSGAEIHRELRGRKR